MRSNSIGNIIRATQFKLVPDKDTPQTKNSDFDMTPEFETSHNLIEKLQEQLNEAHREIKELKQMIGKNQPRQNYYSILDAEHEEEIVAKETAWMLPKSKKRKRSTEKVNASITHEKVSRPSPMRAHNRRSGSLGNSIVNQRVKEIKVRELNPPPIILSNMTDYAVINQSLQEKNLKFKANLLNNNQLKINADSESDYRNLTKYFNDTKMEWHTYENKQTRPIRVMVRNLHHSCNPETIKKELID